MKSKEGILNKIAVDYEKFDDKLIMMFERTEIIKAMDEYAQGMSVGFAEWCNINDWYISEQNEYGCKWTNSKTYKNTYTPDLYQQFIDNLNKG